VSILAFAVLLAVLVPLAWLALRGRDWRRIGGKRGGGELLFYGSDGATTGSDACGADGGGGGCDGGSDGGD
jgi:hypothetical protein